MLYQNEILAILENIGHQDKGTRQGNKKRDKIKGQDKFSATAINKAQKM